MQEIKIGDRFSISITCTDNYLPFMALARDEHHECSYLYETDSELDAWKHSIDWCVSQQQRHP